MKHFLTFLLCICSINAQDLENLEEIVTQDDQITTGSPKGDGINESTQSAKDISRQQSSDIKDLTRYETGISVVEGERSGNSGFAIRGVDENRVGIIVDGLKQSETLSSQGFKELFSGYGNFNNTRNGVEILTLKKVQFTKGADSIKIGSGALGGSVLFTTKDPSDFLKDKNFYGGFESGTQSKNGEFFNSISLAARFVGIEALFIHTKRKSHELLNFDYNRVDPLVQGKRREKTDPYQIQSDSDLLKISYEITENHKITLSGDFYNADTNGEDLSYTLKYSKTTPDAPERDTRHIADKTSRTNIGGVYEYKSDFLDSLKLSVFNQEIKTRARIDEYCDGGTIGIHKCQEIYNPLGIKLTNGKITRRDGSAIELADKDTYKDSDGSLHQNGFAKKAWNQDYYFDCSIYDCNAKHEYFKCRYSCCFTCEKMEIDLSDSSKFEAFTHQGKTFKKPKDTSWYQYFILPADKGYLERLWGQRDLDTSTLQFALDSKKNLNYNIKNLELEHEISLAANYDLSTKAMINNAGNDATQVQWWAPRTLGQRTSYTGSGAQKEPETCANTTSWDANLCPRIDPTFSYLLPVTTTTKAIVLSNNFAISKALFIEVGARLDDINYEPKYIKGKTPKLPDDIIKGLFIQAPKNAKDAEISQNIDANINYIASAKRRYIEPSFVISANIKPLSFLDLGAKISRAFRSPTSDEIYFTFKHPDFTILPNLKLKAETAINTDISATLHRENYGFIKLSSFKSNYENFIDLAFLGRKNFPIVNGGSTLDFNLYSNVNRQSASV